VLYPIPIFGHVPSTLSAKRKRNKVTTAGMSTCCNSKITSRISGMYRSQRLRGPKAWVCGNSLVETAGSNPAGGMDVCVLCVVRYATPHRANHSPRGVLQGMVCRVRQTQIMRRPWPTRVCHTRGGGGEIGYNIILRPEIVFGTKSILQSRMFKFVWNLRLFTAPLRI